jgi:hypothetical protein
MWRHFMWIIARKNSKLKYDNYSEITFTEWDIMFEVACTLGQNELCHGSDHDIVYQNNPI